MMMILMMIYRRVNLYFSSHERRTEILETEREREIERML